MLADMSVAIGQALMKNAIIYIIIVISPISFGQKSEKPDRKRKNGLQFLGHCTHFSINLSVYKSFIRAERLSDSRISCNSVAEGRLIKS